jgi:uncharacterized protein YndB with AHSA1/START domain
MRFALTYERELALPIERVWWALIDREALAQWFMETDIRAERDHAFIIRGEPEGAWRGWTDCRILEIEPPCRIVWSFEPDDESDPTIVTFTLTPTETGTLLKLSHDGSGRPGIIGQLGQGWPGFLERLAKWLETGAPG